MCMSCDYVCIFICHVTRYVYLSAVDNVVLCVKLVDMQVM